MVEVLVADSQASVPSRRVIEARHELRSSLTIIQGNAQLARRRLRRVDGLVTAEARQLGQHLTAIEVAISRLAVVVDQLLPPPSPSASAEEGAGSMDAVFGPMPSSEVTPDVKSAVPLGAPVVDAAGDKLGTVRDADSIGLVVEQGTFFITTRLVPYTAAARVEDGTIWLKWTKDELDRAE